MTTSSTSSYAGAPGAPSDPDTPGPYCLARCLCGSCPQHAAQRAALELLIEQERGQRIAREGAPCQRDRDRRRRGGQLEQRLTRQLPTWETPERTTTP